MTLARRLVAEGLGTTFLLAAVVGSGIMGERLAGGNDALALLANAIATGAALIALIITFGPLSGAHFNPVVSLSAASSGDISWGIVPAYCLVQVLGAFAGVAVAHLMFNEPLFAASLHERSGAPQVWSEFVATFGLVAVIRGCQKQRLEAVAIAVAAYITAAYWFTASTSFANPAVTLARSATNTFSGIHLADVPAFVVSQLLGAGFATALFRWITPVAATPAEEIGGDGVITSRRARL